MALLAVPQALRTAVREGMELAVGSVIPSLFVFSVLTQFLVRMRLLAPLESLISPVFGRLFRLPGAVFSAFLCGAVGGYPLGAQTVAALYRDGALSKSTAETALAFCSNCGIAYIVCVVGPTIGLTVRESLLLYVLHLSSAVAVGWIAGRLSKQRDFSADNRTKPSQSSLASALSLSVADAAASMVTLTGMICFFRAATAAAEVVGVSVPKVLWGLTELSAGIASLGEGQVVAAAFLLGAGGICILCQTSVSVTPLKLKKYLPGKLLQALLSAALAALFF